MIRPQFFLKILFLFFIVVVGVSIVGLGNSSEAPDGRGEGSSMISGVEVINVHFGLNSKDPSSIESISFQLSNHSDPSSSLDIQVELAPGTTWFSCKKLGDFWECPINSNITIKEAEEFHVLAVVSRH